MQNPDKELPYKPITFILTQTIGGNNNKSVEQQSQTLDIRYKDILVPTSVRDTKNLYLYYLFHIAPIYNWLRNMKVVGESEGCLQKSLLSQYISANFDKSNLNFNLAPCVIAPNLVINQILPLCSKYDILKQCLLAKIKILRQFPRSDCKHYLKLSTFSHCYYYENNEENSKGIKDQEAFGRNEGRLKISRFYCKQCELWIDMSNSNKKENTQSCYQIQNYPIAPLFDKYYGQIFTVQPNHQQKKVVRYRLAQIYSPHFLLVMAANGIWYILRYQQQVGSKNSFPFLGQMKICTKFNEIISAVSTKKWTGYCVYIKEQMISECGILRPAIAMHQNQSILKSKNQKSKHIELKSREKPQSDKIVNSRIKGQNQMQKNLMSMREQQPMPQDLQPINQYKFNSTSNINLSQVLSCESKQKYLAQLQKIYPKQKEKDDYQKDYDKGKTKKIKKKIDYIKPDFNQIFKNVKKEVADQLSGKKTEQDNSKKLGDRGYNKQLDSKNIKDQKDGKFRDRGGRGFRGNNKFRGNNNFRGRKNGRQMKRQQKKQFLQKFDAS